MVAEGSGAAALLIGHDAGLELNETGVLILYAESARGMKRAFADELFVPYRAIDEVVAKAPLPGSFGWFKLRLLGADADVWEPRDPFTVLLADRKQWKAFARRQEEISEAVFRVGEHAPDAELLTIVAASQTPVEASFARIDVTATECFADGWRSSLRGLSARVDTSGQMTSRVTMTRAALLGAFAAVAPKKRDDRVLYLTLESPELAVVRELDPAREADAREFAAAVNQLAAARCVAAPEAVSASVVEQIRQLGGLRDAGLITEDEFSAKKAEMLARM